MNAIILTEEMKAAIALLEDERERFIWITGRAGTGKSTFLQHLKTEIRAAKYGLPGSYRRGGPHIGGQTIHSFFWIDPNEKVYLETALDPDRESRLLPLLAKVRDDRHRRDIHGPRGPPRREWTAGCGRRRGSRAFPSAARASCFSATPISFRRSSPIPTAPPASSSGSATRVPFFFSSQVLRTRARKIKRVEFTRVFRQNEADFLATLDRCRSGMLTDDDLDLLQSRVLPEGKKPPADHLVLTAKKDEAERLKPLPVSRPLPGPARSYAAVCSGRFARRARQRGPTRSARARAQGRGPASCSRSNDPGRRWVNGSLATVSGTR